MVADMGADETEAVREKARALRDERLREKGRDTRGLDLEPAGRKATIAHAIPIRVKLLRC
jgi:hypothetical protein